MILPFMKENIKWSKTPFSGVEFCWLSEKTENGRTAILKFDDHAELPLHNHPGWEQIYVLEGRLQINLEIYAENDFVLIEGKTDHSILALEPSKYITISQMEGVKIIE
ncbi:ChrR Cupin-like domain protein [Marinomonas spartinae]|uniref:cupin domain-containing protein n=1 Tax=Marinomonas spartinae TaxID=1792290 RepID=UPI000808EA3E|nr:cupin domain-containing protein [Marinomonas spartinae]SBS38501.1 ChrR Cupin-like domain protein [Marinomonas spartinae]